MPADKEKFDPKDFVSHDDAEDLNDKGDKGIDEEEEEELEEEEDPADKKKPVKKKADKAKDDPDEEEEEEDPDEEEEEDDDKKKVEEDPEKIKMAKKLSRTGKARDRLEVQVRDLQKQLEGLTEKRSDEGKQRLEKLTEKLDGLYDKVEEARAEGKTKEAAGFQREIDKIRDQMSQAQATYYATQQALQQTELRMHNVMVAELEAMDPRFDEDSDEYDEDLVEQIGDLTDAYEAKGLSLSEALRKAVKVILKEDPFGKGRSLRRDEKKTEDKKTELKKTDVKKNAKDSKKQPPDDQDTTPEKAKGKIDVATISEEDWDKLPESKRRELRGDFAT